jgi:putative transposase
VKYRFIAEQSQQCTVVPLCRVMRVSTSAYYAWLKRPARLISAETLQLYRRAKALFQQSRESLGSRGLSQALCKEGYAVGRYRARSLMKTLCLHVVQRQRYKVTTKSDHDHAIANNHLDQRFNPAQPNQVWSTDITYLRTAEGWLYLAIVMDLHSRRIVGWAMDRRMTQALITRSLMMAIALRKPEEGLLHHSDRGSQYTSKRYRKLLAQHGMISSMSGKGNCYDNAVVERFFGSLKHEWLATVRHATRETMKADVNNYIRYYNGTRLHSTLGYQTPIGYEKSQVKVSGKG